MAVLRGVGYNKHSTPFKQYALNSALGHLLGTSVSVAQKHRAPAFVCDMTAGPGHDPAGGEGSPLILARHLSYWIAKGHDLRLVCVDKNAALLLRLRTVLQECYPGVPVEYFADQASALERIPVHAVGLTYWDPTRYNDLDRALLSRFGRSHKYMDILITRECLAGYRMQRADHCPDTLTIQDYLALTGKKCNYIMQYAKHGWWSLGFADNWVGRPTRKLRGFCNVESDEGKRLYRKWTADVDTESEMAPEPVSVQELSLW